MRLIKVELMKLKRMFVIEAAIIAPIIAIASGVGVSHQMIKDGVSDYWAAIWPMSAFTLGGFVIPIFVMYVSIVLGRVENENDCWKQVLSLPIKKSKIYLAKFMAVLSVVIVMFISFLIEFQVAGYLLGAKGLVPVQYIKVSVLGFLAILPVIALEFILSRKFKSVSIPLAVGMFLTGSGFLITQSSYWKYAPWTYCNYAFFSNINSVTLESIWYIGVAILIFLILLTVDVISFYKEDV